MLPDIAAKGCDELWLNPGTESDEVLAEAERLKLNVVQACSIVGLGSFARVLMMPRLQVLENINAAAGAAAFIAEIQAIPRRRPQWVWGRL